MAKDIRIFFYGAILFKPVFPPREARARQYLISVMFVYFLVEQTVA